MGITGDDTMNNQGKDFPQGNKAVNRFVFALLLLNVSAFSAHPVTAADPVVVIVNKADPVTSLDLGTVRKYYENDLLQWEDGRQITLYDLRVKDEARGTFSREVLQKEPDAVAMEWAHKKISNTAKNPPRTVSSEGIFAAAQ
jgi:ABC-type phosphate transport system substrate-binding protein